MSINVVMRLECLHCANCFFEAVSLIRPHGSAFCPACGKLFVLDPEIEAMGRLLKEAKAARRERKRRRQELQTMWRCPAAPTEPARPLLTEVLARLDALLAELEETSASRA
jgi:uncharacterized Zn finger protein (UPF0148 family)